MIKKKRFSLFFHGTGNGGRLDLGCSAATLEVDQAPELLIDCGPGTLASYERQYGRLPTGIFITHAHLDHIADLEILQVRAKLTQTKPIRLWVPLTIVPLLHHRLACYPGALAEGGHDFWRSFQLLPVTEHFELNGNRFILYASRHHGPESSFSLHLPGCFFYSGDTRPIPEVLHHKLIGTETLFHDCAPISNPSHTGLDNLKQEYQSNILKKLVLYHYPDTTAGDKMRSAGYQVANPGDRFEL
jgi:ribonuclease BN (tRNA processing enzyme)